MKWSGERYKCRQCGEVYPYSLSKCNCGGVCDKIEDAAMESGQSVLSEILEAERQKEQDEVEKELARLYNAVKEACSKNEYSVAITYLDKILEITPDSVEAKDLLDFCKKKIEQANQNREKENPLNEENLIKLADQLNQRQYRQTSFAFEIMALFGSSLRSKLNFYLLLISIAIIIIILAGLIYDPEVNTVWQYFGMGLFLLFQPIVWCIAFFFQIRPYKTLLFLFKLGHFTIGRRDNNNRLSFTDAQGVQRICNAEFNEIYDSNKQPFLVVYNICNPDINYAMRVTLNSKVDDIIDLITIVPFVEDKPYALKFNYNLSNNTFVKGLGYIWLQFAILAFLFIAVNLIACLLTLLDEGALSCDGYLGCTIAVLFLAGVGTTFAPATVIVGWVEKHYYSLFCIINPIFPVAVILFIFAIFIALFGT